MPAKDIPVHSDRMAQVLDTSGIPLRIDTIYSNHKGVEKSGVRKNAEQVLGKLNDILKKVLRPDEAILYIMPAQAPMGELQQFTLGWMSYNVSRTMLVLTNKRILAFHANPKGFRNWDWARRIRSIAYGDLTDARVSWFLSSSLKLRYADGRKETYWGIRGGDAKKLRLILEAVMPGRGGEATEAQGPVSLCPGCAAALVPKQEACRTCGQLFATEKEMWKRSILFPGGGYFYAGQTGLGILDAFAETIFIGMFAAFLMIAAGVPDFMAGDLDPYSTRAGAAVGAGLIGVILIIEKLVTGFHGRHIIRDFHPLSGPPNNGKWFLFGALAYGAVAAVLALAVAATPAPIGKIGEDIELLRADFGVFGQDREGGDTFTATNIVSQAPGTRYGFLVRFRTPRPNVKLKTQFEIPGLEIPEGAEMPEGLKPHEEEVSCEGGIIARYWGVQADEPAEQKLSVFVNDQLVRSFAFQVGRGRPAQKGPQ